MSTHAHYILLGINLNERDANAKHIIRLASTAWKIARYHKPASLHYIFAGPQIGRMKRSGQQEILRKKYFFDCNFG